MCQHARHWNMAGSSPFVEKKLARIVTDAGRHRASVPPHGGKSAAWLETKFYLQTGIPDSCSCKQAPYLRSGEGCEARGWTQIVGAQTGAKRSRIVAGVLKQRSKNNGLGNSVTGAVQLKC